MTRTIVQLLWSSPLSPPLSYKGGGQRPILFRTSTVFFVDKIKREAKKMGMADEWSVRTPCEANKGVTTATFALLLFGEAKHRHADWAPPL